MVPPAHLEPMPMNPLAANRTARHSLPTGGGLVKDCSFVEDLNWPAAPPTPDRKLPRPTEMWVPGPDGQWGGVPPTLQ
jgi:hypothetical protein